MRCLFTFFLQTRLNKVKPHLPIDRVMKHIWIKREAQLNTYRNHIFQQYLKFWKFKACYFDHLLSLTEFTARRTVLDGFNRGNDVFSNSFCAWYAPLFVEICLCSFHIRSCWVNTVIISLFPFLGAEIIANKVVISATYVSDNRGLSLHTEYSCYSCLTNLECSSSEWTHLQETRHRVTTPPCSEILGFCSQIRF